MRGHLKKSQINGASEESLVAEMVAREPRIEEEVPENPHLEETPEKCQTKEALKNPT